MELWADGCVRPAGIWDLVHLAWIGMVTKEDLGLRA